MEPWNLEEERGRRQLDRIQGDLKLGILSSQVELETVNRGLMNESQIALK